MPLNENYTESRRPKNGSVDCLTQTVKFLCPIAVPCNGPKFFDEPEYGQGVHGNKVGNNAHAWPEKAVYFLTDAGNEEFEKLMLEISCKPINIFLDFNAVIVNLESMEKEQQRNVWITLRAISMC